MLSQTGRGPYSEPIIRRDCLSATAANHPHDLAGAYRSGYGFQGCRVRRDAGKARCLHCWLDTCFAQQGASNRRRATILRSAT